VEFLNPNGILAQGQGLRAEAMGVQNKRRDPVGIVEHSRQLPRVARSSRPWTEGQNLVSIEATRTILCWLMLLVQLSLLPQIYGQIAREYDRRAACLYKLAEFVDWPSQAFPTDQTPFVIGVLGTDPFGKSLDEIAQNEVAKNRKLVVERYNNVIQIRSCHILFISPSEEARLDQILSALKGKSILTVGETEDFVRRGGVLRFRTERNALRLRINLEAAKAANLTMSSKLLHIAELVSTSGEGR
jgi:hypothetical protein